MPGNPIYIFSVTVCNRVNLNEILHVFNIMTDTFVHYCLNIQFSITVIRLATVPLTSHSLKIFIAAD